MYYKPTATSSIPGFRHPSRGLRPGNNRKLKTVHSAFKPTSLTKILPTTKLTKKQLAMSATMKRMTHLRNVGGDIPNVGGKRRKTMRRMLKSFIKF